MFRTVRMVFEKHSGNLRKTFKHGIDINAKSCSDFSEWMEVAQHTKSPCRKKIARNVKSCQKVAELLVHGSVTVMLEKKNA